MEMLRLSLKRLYRVLTLTGQTYMESLLNDGSAHDDRYPYGVTHDDESAPDGHSDSLYRVLTLMARPTRRFSSKTKALLMVTLTAYIRSSP